MEQDLRPNWNQPDQRLRPTLFLNITFVGVCFLASHKGQTQWSVVRRSLRFFVLIREVKNIKPFAHVTRKVTKLAHSTQLVLAWGSLYLWANVVLTRLYPCPFSYKRLVSDYFCPHWHLNGSCWSVYYLGKSLMYLGNAIQCAKWIQRTMDSQIGHVVSRMSQQAICSQL